MDQLLDLLDPPWTFVPLAELFGAYLFFIVLFAKLYHDEYRVNPNAYVFVSTIANTQARVLQANAAALLSKRIHESQLLTAVESELARKPQVDLELIKAPLLKRFFIERWRVTLDAATIEVEDRAIPGPPDLLSRNITLIAPDGARYTSLAYLGPPPEPFELRSLVSTWSESARDGASRLTAELESLSSPTPRIWEFSDFLYFSVITQTTVGYGDILPNSSRVRLLVVGQILIAYVLLVVALNVVLSLPH